jgi:negative regulator of flagellin synthesis FlgM
MEIDGSKPLTVTNANVQRIDASQAQRPKNARTSSSSDSDRLELSVRSREISQLDELVRSTPDIREFRVEQVRRSIEAGTYNVKAEKIAEKIIGGSILDEVF